MAEWTLAHPDNECSFEKEWGGSPWTDLKDFQDVLLNEKSKVQECITGCYPSCKKKKKGACTEIHLLIYAKKNVGRIN